MTARRSYCVGGPVRFIKPTPAQAADIVVAVESGRMRVVPPWPPVAAKEERIRRVCDEVADRIEAMGYFTTVQSQFAGFYVHTDRKPRQ